MKNFLRLGCLILLTVVAGCSKIRMAYDWADTMILWKMDDYFDIESDQKQKARAVVKRELREILENEVPKWSKTLRSLAVDVLDPKFNHASYRLQRDKLTDFYWQTIGRLVGPAMELTTVLKPEQFDYLKKATDKYIKKEEDKIASTSAREYAKQRYLKLFDFIYIELTAEQVKLLDEHVSQSALPQNETFATRRDLVEKYVQAAKKAETLKIYLTQLMSPGPSDLRPATRVEKMRKYQDAAARFEFQLFQKLSSEQRQRLHERLNDIAKQLDDLRAREGSAVPQKS